MSGNSTDSSKKAPAADPTPLIPAASLKGTAGILDTVSVSLMTLGGLNWLSEAIGTAAGAKSPNMVAGLSSLVGVPQLATFVYLLVGIAAAYFFNCHNNWYVFSCMPAPSATANARSRSPPSSYCTIA